VPVLAAYGHSWVKGSAATTTAKRFVNIAATRLGFALENMGIGGSLSVETAEMVTARPPVVLDFYVLMTGVNDARLYGWRSAALDDYGIALVRILDAFVAANPHCGVVTVAQPCLCDYSQHAPYDQSCDGLVDAYNSRIKEVAGRYPQVKLATARCWDKHTMLADDKVHPNDQGHRAFARRLPNAQSVYGVRHPAVVQRLESSPSSLRHGSLHG
jgi:lysophospholipase L1-like esterase